jgi:hypothetical protein
MKDILNKLDAISSKTSLCESRTLESYGDKFEKFNALVDQVGLVSLWAELVRWLGSRDMQEFIDHVEGAFDIDVDQYGDLQAAIDELETALGPKTLMAEYSKWTTADELNEFVDDFARVHDIELDSQLEDTVIESDDDYYEDDDEEVFSEGDRVHSPEGLGTIAGVSPSGKFYVVDLDHGDQSAYHGSQLKHADDEDEDEDWNDYSRQFDFESVHEGSDDSSVDKSNAVEVMKTLYAKMESLYDQGEYSESFLEEFNENLWSFAHKLGTTELVQSFFRKMETWYDDDEYMTLSQYGDEMVSFADNLSKNAPVTESKKINESFSITSTVNDAGEQSVSVNATGQHALMLAEILKLSGLNTADDCGCSAVTTEEYANEPDEKYLDTETQLVGLSGGINGPKGKHFKQRPGDNPLAADDRGYNVKESSVVARDTDMDGKTVIVTGVQGLNDKKFRKKFKTQSAAERWIAKNEDNIDNVRIFAESCVDNESAATLQENFENGAKVTVSSTVKDRIGKKYAGRTGTVSGKDGGYILVKFRGGREVEFRASELTKANINETDDWGQMTKQQFKQRELDHELGSETNSVPAAQNKVFNVVINGKVWKKAGTPVEFKSMRHARAVTDKIKVKNPTYTIQIVSAAREQGSVSENAQQLALTNQLNQIVHRKQKAQEAGNTTLADSLARQEENLRKRLKSTGVDSNVNGSGYTSM